MGIAALRYRCMALGVTLASACAAGGTGVTAVTPGQPAAAVVSAPVRLAANGDSVLNIPFNLIQDVVDIPNTEVEALNTLAKSLFFTGPWFTASATNLWGEDPGDPGHFMALTDLLIPFSRITGLGSPEIEPAADAAGTAGLGQQLSLLAAAELPVSATCDADWCAPWHPTTPITGLARLDWAIWTLAILTGQQRFPFLDDWFSVPLSELTKGGFTFGDVAEPSSGVGPGGSVPSDDTFGFPGTSPGPDGENMMPWSGITFKFDPLEPFQGFFRSLLAPANPTGFEFPGIEEIGRTLQSVVAGLALDFTPFVAGSGTCPGQCDVPAVLTPEGAVKAIGGAWPGNQLIDHWLDLAAKGMANGPTQEQIDFGIKFVQGPQMVFDLGNPPPSEVPPGVETPAPFDVDPLMAGLIQTAKDSGVQGFVQMMANLAGFEPAF